MVLRNSRWMPARSVTCHSGDPLLPVMDFFIPPPTEIGKIISAETNVKLTAHHPSPIFNCTVLAIASIIAAILGDILLLAANREPQARTIVSSLFASIVAYIGFAYYPIFPYCSYIGENGIAQFRQFGLSPRKAHRFMLVFQDVTDLFQ